MNETKKKENFPRDRKLLDALLERRDMPYHYTMKSLIKNAGMALEDIARHY